MSRRRASPSSASVSCSHRSTSCRGFGPQLGQPRRGRPVLGPEELDQQLGALGLHRVGHGHPVGPQHAQRGELRVRPLAGQDVAAERRAVGHGAHLPRAAHPPSLEVAGVAVEHAVLGGAVALGREQRAPLGAGHVPLDEVDVGLLARLDDAQLGVDGGVIGDHPPGAGFRAVQRTVPRGPAVALRRAVEVGAAALVERGDVGRRATAPMGRSGLVVVETLLATATGHG